MARRATRAHRTLYLLFCSCSTRSLTHWEQNCNLKSLGSVLTGAPRTERYRYRDLRGNQILATDMSKYVLCWAELVQLCPHDIVSIQSITKRCAHLVKPLLCRAKSTPVDKSAMKFLATFYKLLRLCYHYCHRIVFGRNQVDFFANKTRFFLPLKIFCF